MANYYTDRYNRFIDKADEIYAFLTGNYMDGLENHLLDYGWDCIEIDRMQFIRILQYRRTESVQRDFELIRSSMEVNLQCCAGQGAAFGYFVVSKDGEYSIFLAIEGLSTDRFVKNMNAAISDLSFKIGFIPSWELEWLAGYGGIISGDIECAEIIMDRILSALNGINGIIGLLAVPMDRRETALYTDELSRLKQMTEDLLNDDPSGNLKMNRRNYKFVPELDRFLEKEIDYYGDTGEDYWKSCICFGCEQKEDALLLGNSVTSVLNGSNKNVSDKARCYPTVYNPFQGNMLSLPLADYSSLEYELASPLRKPSLLSYVSTSHLAGIIQFPAYQVRGFDVIELEKDKNSLHLFDTNHIYNDGKVIRIGRVTDLGEPYSINIKDLTEHVLVTGATGAGKTNTVMGLVKGIVDAGIPVLIIEPSKKDYYHLASEIRNLSIYSFGQDAKLLRINPLMPEEGVIIVNHIDSLLYAFSGAFEMEEPTRLALDGLLKYTYERFGWRMGDIAFPSGKSYPRLQDMLFLLPEYVNTQLAYGDEVRNNIYGSIANRLYSLNSGMIGESVNSAEPISGKTLCSGPVLVELDDLSLEAKPFMAMLLMIKADQYLRQKDASSSLQNVIVLEEAHNIFANISDRSVRSSREQSSRYFSNMLSQIREYGTGIIVADQGASQINDMAVSNTKVKIIHSVVDGQDIDKVAFALNLTEIQKRVFPSLSTGEVVVSVRGQRSVVKVIADRVKIDPIRNTACVFCTKRQHCNYFNMDNDSTIPRRFIYAQLIYEMRFCPQSLQNELNAVARHIGWAEDNTLCLLGHLLADGSIRCGEREKRRIIMAYSERAEV